jgi:hypothetical protein
MDSSIARLPDKAGSPCPHPDRGFFKYPFRVGDGFHVIEWCPACRRNVRGGSTWVPRPEVVALGIDPAGLPLLPGKATPPQPPTLFAAEGGEGRP